MIGFGLYVLGGNTFIQRDGIARELGVSDSPDDFYVQHGTILKGIKGWLYRTYFYKQLNANIERIRQERVQVSEVSPCEHVSTEGVNDS